MKDIKISRRTFLRSTSLFLLGPLFLQVERFLTRADKSTNSKTASPREAKYYKTSDHLAG